jgi:hypothetical protein
LTDKASTIAPTTFMLYYKTARINSRTKNNAVLNEYLHGIEQCNWQDIIDIGDVL